MKIITLTASVLASFFITANAGAPLSGLPIGSQPANAALSIPDKAFDGDLSTYYESSAASYAWVGLDLGTPHIIKRIGFAPRNKETGAAGLLLGIFEGANSPDFMDAVPIHMIKDAVPAGSRMTYADVDCSRGFRYVRYVGPNGSRCAISEVEFYGTEGKGDDSRLFQITNLPTVVIHTEGKNEPTGKEKADELTSRIMIISEGGTKLLDSSGTTRLRGNSSIGFPKKPYRIKFDKKQNVLDAPSKAKKWTLINNYGDKTLLRNDLAFEIARRLGMEYVPYLAPVDVILNGEYKGNYQLCDQIEVNKGRVEIEEMTTEDNNGDALTGGYLIEIDAGAGNEKQWLISKRWIPATIKSPDDDSLTPEQKKYITDYFNEMEESLWTGGSDSYDRFHSMFDLDSFFSHFLVGEISGNTDTYWSTYMYKHRGNPAFYTGPVWDFDLAFENDIRTYPINASEGYLFNSGLASSVSGMVEFVNRILDFDPKAKPTVKAIWKKALDNGLDARYLSDYIDQRAAMIDESQQLNFIRWDIMNSYVQQNPCIEGSYKGEINRVKKYLEERFDHLDSHIAKYKEPETNGLVKPGIRQGTIRSRGHEATASGFGDSSVFSVIDITGRILSSGIFSGDHVFRIPTEGMVIITVIDGDNGVTATCKIR